MNALKLLPVFISFLLLGAHFLRMGLYFVTAICLALPFLLLIQKKWVARLIQAALLIGCSEWLKTLYDIAQERQESGMPWLRMAMILGFVALFTALSSCVFFFKSLKNKY